MRLPRMTTRRWMALVAAVGCLLYALMLTAEFLERSNRAAGYAAKEREPRLAAEAFAASAEESSRTASRDRRWRIIAMDDRRNVRQFQALIGDYTAMKRKWEQAARRPWLPVSPDPPEPK